MKQFLVIANVSSQRRVADRAEVATTLWRRLTGLLTRHSLEAGEAMMFPRCHSIHTWGMRFSIDVVFLRGPRVVKAVTGLGPCRFAWAPGADAVLELPVGTIAAASIQPDALLQWSAKAEKKT